MRVSRSALFVSVIWCLILMAPLSAFAHKPLFEDHVSNSLSNAIKIADPQVSYAIYASLTTPTDVHVYALEVSKPMNLHAGLLVPKAPGYEDFYPVYALAGPGLPESKVKLPIELPPGYGAIVISGKPESPRPVFDEPFSRTQYYEGIPDFDRQVSQTGTYYYIVWHPAGETGSFTGVVGEQEKFGLKDLIPVAKAIRVIHSGQWIIKRGK